MRKRENAQPAEQNFLGGRLSALADELRGRLDPAARKAAQIQPLRKYVSARLTAQEITELALRHRELNLYAVWRSAA
jgi:hypothetical protein